MADLKSGLILKDGEQLVMEIEAELWATSSNPFARLLGEINRVIAMIFGNCIPRSKKDIGALKKGHSALKRGQLKNCQI